MKVNFKQLINWTLKGTAIIGTALLTAYAEGLGKNSSVVDFQSGSMPALTPDDMVISELLKAANSYWSDSDKVNAATKIAEIAKKEGQTAYTKTKAIQAMGKIRDGLWSSYYKSKVTDLIVSIV